MLGYFDAMKVLDKQTEMFGNARNFKELAVFRYLLFHSWWTKDELYGWVQEDWLGIQRIANHTGTTSRSIQRILMDLEASDMLRKGRRSAGRGLGRLPDALYLCWLDKVQDRI